MSIKHSDVNTPKEASDTYSRAIIHIQQYYSNH